MRSPPRRRGEMNACSKVGESASIMLFLLFIRNRPCEAHSVRASQEHAIAIAAYSMALLVPPRLRTVVDVDQQCPSTSGAALANRETEMAIGTKQGDHVLACALLRPSSGQLQFGVIRVDIARLPLVRLPHWTLPRPTEPVRQPSSVRPICDCTQGSLASRLRASHLCAQPGASTRTSDIPAASMPDIVVGIPVFVRGDAGKNEGPDRRQAAPREIVRGLTITTRKIEREKRHETS